MQKIISFVLFFLFLPFVSATEPLNVLTINVRCGAANDGEDHWTKRRDAMVQEIKKINYDFIGGQEVLQHPNKEFNQYEFLCKNLPAYGSVYRPRNESGKNTEGTPVFYRKDRWQPDKEQQETYWLSDIPNIPGSITWEGQSNCPRVVTGGLFHEIDKDGKLTGKSVYFYSTHFDHVGEISRQKAARLILQRIAERKNPGAPVIVVGDLNTGENSPTIRFLKGEAAKIDKQEIKPPLALQDTFRAVYPNEKNVGTYNAFKKGKQGGAKIDFILTTPDLKTMDAEIIRSETPEGRNLSDHYPVRAVLTFKK
jgi:endonuclease/exonuclease/phosphatase family metal-dependent hydrolase